MLCQLPTTPPETVSYWVVAGWQLLQLLRNAKKRLLAAVGPQHPLNAFDANLCKLIVSLYTRLFTSTLRRIEQLLVESLGAPYERSNYFHPDKLAMGRIIAELGQLWGGFERTHWPEQLVLLFFALCVDLVNRFLLNRMLLAPEHSYCTFNNGMRVKMEVAFLSQWLSGGPHAALLAPLCVRLEGVEEAAQLLIMSKSRSNFSALEQFRALNARQLHTLLQQYRGASAVGSGGGGPVAGPTFAVVPPGLSSQSRAIVERIERERNVNLREADVGDAVDPALLRRLEETQPRLQALELPVPDSLPANLSELEGFLRDDAKPAK